MILNVSGIPVKVCKKSIKKMYLYVKPPNGSVSVSAPLSIANEVIEKFILTKTSWIERKIAVFAHLSPRSALEYVSGETMYVWGSRYCLQVESGNKNSLVLSDGQAVLTVGKDSTFKQRERFVRKWYRELLTMEISRLLPKWEEITGLKAAGWQTKSMKTRWGSCNTRTGKIWLNLRLAEKHTECLEYVILHELLHLDERHHNRRFFLLMSLYMPMWKDIRATLNRREE